MGNYKFSQYIPSFLKSAGSGDGRQYVLTFSDIKDSNITEENSFAYNVEGSGMKSTQQLNVDWSRFENHTFFMSAEAKVNLAFEQIVNWFPFDGTRSEVENFFDGLTGFDKWVFDQFPKYRGQLLFSGSQLSETTPDKGTYIVVKDVPGSLFPSLSPDALVNGSVLNPKDGKSMSIEMQLYLPTIPTDGTQIILQKLNSGNNQGFCVRLNQTVSTTHAEIQFDVFSGNSGLTVFTTIEKGIFNHLCFIFDRENTLPSAKIYVNENLASSSEMLTTFKDLSIDYADFLIGSGSQYSIFSTIVTPQQTLSGVMDELRVFHEVRSESQQSSYAKKSIFSTPELKLYYRFNEPPPPLSPITGDLVNSIVLDSSGNSLHSYITNFIDENRQNAAMDLNSNMIYEKLTSCPVLFPANEDVIALNENLLTSASFYDDENPNLITKLIPRHYLLEGAADEGFTSADQNNGSPYGGTGIPGQGKLSNVQLLLSLLYIWAKFFDEIRLHLDAFSKLHNVDYDLNESTPNNFLFDVFKSYGLYLPAFFSNSNIEQYVHGENIDPLVKSNESLSLQDVRHELLRRVIINLPNVIKSKGTQHSIKSFLRAIGIDPESSMRFREYGGPTYRVLEKSREQKADVTAMVSFSTSSFAISPFLSASRTEVGSPTPAGIFVDQGIHSFHGISNDPNDGLFTSGSWTLEASYKYNLFTDRLTSLTQSLVRFCVTGSGISNPGVTANLVATYDESSPKIDLYLRPGDSSTSPVLNMSLDLPKEAIFNGDVWCVSFGCDRNDSIHSNVSSSYFLRVGAQNDGELRYYETTSSYFYETPSGENNVYRALDPLTNASGSFVMVGNSQIPGGASSTYLFLNNTSQVNFDKARCSIFDGRVMKMRFWSKSFSKKEWTEHIKNYQSVGVFQPNRNYNYEKILTGSFERLRMDVFSKQENRIADVNEEILFLDFSENEMHMQGLGFPSQKNCFVPEIIRYSHLSPYFDEPLTNEKVRVRGYNHDEFLDENPWAARAPVYEIIRSESPIDDARFSIDFSIVDALNKDMTNMFSTFESMDNMLGKPELNFSPDYPDVDRLRSVYFNRLKQKLNFKAFFEFYSWFDNSINVFIEQLLPKKTVYKGANYVVESHMLERHKHEYYFFETYVKQAKTANLSQFSNE